MRYARATVRFGIGLLWLTPVAVLGSFALDLSPDGVPVPVEHRLLYLAICAPFLALSLRTMRIGLFTEPDGVTVRGVLRTRQIPWDQIAAFEWGKWGGFDLPMVRRTDGSCVVIYALNPPLGDHGGVDAILQKLNAVLAEQPGSRSSDPDSARFAA